MSETLELLINPKIAPFTLSGNGKLKFSTFVLMMSGLGMTAMQTKNFVQKLTDILNEKSVENLSSAERFKTFFETASSNTHVTGFSVQSALFALMVIAVVLYLAQVYKANKQHKEAQEKYKNSPSPFAEDGIQYRNNLFLCKLFTLTGILVGLEAITTGSLGLAKESNLLASNLGLPIFLIVFGAILMAATLRSYRELPNEIASKISPASNPNPS